MGIDGYFYIQQLKIGNFLLQLGIKVLFYGSGQVCFFIVGYIDFCIVFYNDKFFFVVYVVVYVFDIDGERMVDFDKLWIL